MISIYKDANINDNIELLNKLKHLFGDNSSAVRIIYEESSKFAKQGNIKYFKKEEYDEAFELFLKVVHAFAN